MSNGGKITRTIILEQHDGADWTVRSGESDALVTRLGNDEALWCVVQAMLRGAMPYGGWHTMSEEVARHNWFNRRRD